jgi:hypothetical protein
MSDQPRPRIVELGPDNQLTLPDEVARRFRPTDRFLIWPQGDTLILKRVAVRRVTDIVEAASEDEAPLTLKEINTIVHQARKESTES